MHWRTVEERQIDGERRLPGLRRERLDVASQQDDRRSKTLAPGPLADRPPAGGVESELASAEPGSRHLGRLGTER